MCISWTRKGFISLMHGVTMKIVAVCSQIRTKHIHSLCGQNVEFLNVKTVGPRSNFRETNGCAFFGRFALAHLVYVSYYLLLQFSIPDPSREYYF